LELVSENVPLEQNLPSAPPSLGNEIVSTEYTLSLCICLYLISDIISFLDLEFRNKMNRIFKARQLPILQQILTLVKSKTSPQILFLQSRNKKKQTEQKKTI
jgi:hypothetical protein